MKKISLFLLLLLIGSGVHFITSRETAEKMPPSANFVKLPTATNKVALFSIYPEPRPVPDTAFINEAGDSVRLDDFKGKTLLVNFWATWCLPCREEMPELDKLQAQLGGDDFQVMVISVDRSGLEGSRAFLDDINIQHLDLFYDKRGKLARQMKAIGYPATILIKPDGRQYGMLLGPASWNSPAAKTLIKSILSPTN